MTGDLTSLVGSLVCWRHNGPQRMWILGVVVGVGCSPLGARFATVLWSDASRISYDLMGEWWVKCISVLCFSTGKSL